jgi:hypothetical protein
MGEGGGARSDLGESILLYIMHDYFAPALKFAFTRPSCIRLYRRGCRPTVPESTFLFAYLLSAINKESIRKTAF